MAYKRLTYDAILQIRAPKSFARLLDQAADSHMMSRSDFIRGALADRIKAEQDAGRLIAAGLS